MILEKIYNFNLSDYDKYGFHKKKEYYLFADFIKDCEKDFYEEYGPFFANAIYANVSVMYLLKSCFSSDETDIPGMESNEGKIDNDMDFKTGEYIENNAVYGLGCSIEGKENEEIYLVTDNLYSDSEFSLKFIPSDDGDAGDRIDLTAPVNKLGELVC